MVLLLILLVYIWRKRRGVVGPIIINMRQYFNPGQNDDDDEEDDTPENKETELTTA